MQSWRGLCWSLMLALSLLGCERVQRARQCQQLATTVNRAADDVEALSRVKPNSLMLEQVSARYRQLSDQLLPMSLAEPLAMEVAHYQKSLVEAAKLTASMAKEKGIDRSIPHGNSSKLERMKQQQIAQMSKIDRWCKLR